MVTLNKHSQDSKENKKLTVLSHSPDFGQQTCVVTKYPLPLYKVETGFEVICNIFTQINLNYFKKTCINTSQ